MIFDLAVYPSHKQEIIPISWFHHCWTDIPPYGFSSRLPLMASVNPAELQNPTRPEFQSRNLYVKVGQTAFFTAGVGFWSFAGNPPVSQQSCFHPSMVSHNETVLNLLGITYEWGFLCFWGNVFHIVPMIKSSRHGVESCCERSVVVLTSW